MTKCSNIFGFGALVLMSLALSGQVPQTGQIPAGPARMVESVRPDYELGPNDQFLIGVPQAQEINQRPFRIDSDGFIDLPLVGRIHAAGLTVR